MKTILITGISGYLGSNLAGTLIRQGNYVVGLKRTSSDMGGQEWAGAVDFYDIESNGVERIFADHAVDVVIHTATSYGRNGETTVEMAHVNTELPHQILEHSLTSDVPVFINTGTSLDRFVNSYALSKSHFVDWARFLVAKTSMRFINVRLEHFYGPGESTSKFVSWIVEQCKRNVAEIPLTKGEQKRDFIYIDDVVSAYLEIISRISSFTEGFNEVDIGSGELVTIRELVSTIKSKTGADTVLNFGAMPYRENETMISEVNLGKMLDFGWRPRMSLDKGLENLINQETEQ